MSNPDIELILLGNPHIREVLKRWNTKRLNEMDRGLTLVYLALKDIYREQGERGGYVHGLPDEISRLRDVCACLLINRKEADRRVDEKQHGR